MLQAAANLAPRGVYVCGNTTSTAGLTVTLCKEGGTGDFALEAGALVLADQGWEGGREGRRKEGEICPPCCVCVYTRAVEGGVRMERFNVYVFVRMLPYM